MELYVFCLAGVMILTTVILKGIICWTQCFTPPARQVSKFIKKQKKELSQSKSKLVQLEIPMEDMERTSTPVPMEEKKASRTDFHSDV